MLFEVTCSVKIELTSEDAQVDRPTALALVKALSEHLNERVRLILDGEVLAERGEEEGRWGPGEITEREKALREEIEDLRTGGPPRGHDKIEGLGKLFVRERLNMIFDELEYEDGTFAGYGNEDRTPADGMITGVGSIDGRTVFFSANDYTVKAGSLGMMGVEKELRIAERAADVGAPILRLIDSTGARLSGGDREPGDTHAGRYRGGRQFFNQCIHSGRIPQIGVLYGPDIAGSAYTPVFCDFLIMVEDISGMAIASPRVVKEMTGEEVDMASLGGPEVHARHSGSAELVVPDERTAARKARALLSYLPKNHRAKPPVSAAREPAENPHELDGVIPDSSNRPYNVQKLIERLVDEDSWFELHPDYAPEMLTGFARLDGHPVGLVANQPVRKAGAIFPDSADKAAGFIWKCDAYGIPLVYLCDTPGFMIGSKVEKEGVLQKGRKFIYATSSAQVPKFCVITRKAYGAGIYAMCGPAFGPDATLALPSAEISVMGPQAIVSALFGDQLAEMDEEEQEEFVEAARQQYDEFVDLKKQAGKMQVDEIVPPGDLRDQLIRRLDVFRDKPRRDPERHHGTILF